MENRVNFCDINVKCSFIAFFLKIKLSVINARVNRTELDQFKQDPLDVTWTRTDKLKDLAVFAFISIITS